MDMKEKFKDAFMDCVERFAQLSSARRLKVGAIIVKDNRIISIGYNGMPQAGTITAKMKLDGMMSHMREEYKNKVLNS